jgi:hypothetical protein
MGQWNLALQLPCPTITVAIYQIVRPTCNKKLDFLFAWSFQGTVETLDASLTRKLCLVNSLCSVTQKDDGTGSKRPGDRAYHAPNRNAVACRVSE